MKWINVDERFPSEKGYYKCICRGFNKILRCKFKKAKDGPREWSPNYFIYKKRCPIVLAWREEVK